MSFILHEYLEGHQIGRQLGIFDLPWDQICEIITEWRKLEPGEVSTLFGIEATVDQANMIWGWNYLNFLIYPTIVSAYYGSWVCLLRAYRKGQI